jgi:hypothetical protein
VAVHRVTGKTNAEATESFRQALTRAANGDKIELDYGIECQGPFLIWSRIEIIGSDPGAHTLYATTSPVLSIGISGVTLRKIGVHYAGEGDGVAIQALPGVRPALENVDIEGQVIYAAMRKEDARAQPAASGSLDFGTVEKPDHTQPVNIRNTGNSSWKYAVESENWLVVTPAAGYLHPDQEQTLQVALNPNIKLLPPERWLDYPAGVRLAGADMTLDIPVRLFYQPPAPKLSRLPLKSGGALQLDTSPVIFLPGSDWQQQLTRRLMNDTGAVMHLSVVVPAWLEVSPVEFSLAPQETRTLVFRPKSPAPSESKALRGIVMLRDASGNTLTMISAGFDWEAKAIG